MGFGCGYGIWLWAELLIHGTHCLTQTHQIYVAPCAVVLASRLLGELVVPVCVSCVVFEDRQPYYART